MLLCISAHQWVRVCIENGMEHCVALRVSILFVVVGIQPDTTAANAVQDVFSMQIVNAPVGWLLLAYISFLAIRTGS